MLRDLAISCDGIDCNRLLTAWRWLVPADVKPLLLGIFGDWVFEAHDSSYWHLDLLEGQLCSIADCADEFNAKKAEQEYREKWFGSDWADIALHHGMRPDHEECLGWKILPIMGGPFDVSNICVYPLMTYQTISGQIFRQIAGK